MKKKLPVIIAVVLIIVIIAITAGTKILERFSYSKEDGPECILWFETGEDVALVLNNEIKEKKENCQRADAIWIWIRCMSTLMTGFMPIITKGCFYIPLRIPLSGRRQVLPGKKDTFPLFWITA